MRCDTCDPIGAPVEGMTGMCRGCFGVFCLGHLGNHGCESQRAPSDAESPDQPRPLRPGHLSEQEVRE